MCLFGYPSDSREAANSAKFSEISPRLHMHQHVCSIAQKRNCHGNAADESMNFASALRSCCVSRGCFKRYRARLPSVSIANDLGQPQSRRHVTHPRNASVNRSCDLTWLSSLVSPRVLTIVKARGLPRRRQRRDCLYTFSSIQCPLTIFAQLRRYATKGVGVEFGLKLAGGWK
jgi:hypothetical protein